MQNKMKLKSLIKNNNNNSNESFIYFVIDFLKM